MSRSLPVVEGYTFFSCVGSGTFGEVYKGIRNSDAKEVAGKFIQNSKLKTKKLRESLEKEASIQAEAKHPNIVTLLEVIKSPNDTLLIMEYCDGGDLAEFLEKKKRLSEQVAKRFLQQIVSALDFMNEHRIIHRDIKPKNILLTSKDENATLKLADFGFARIIDAQGVADTQCGTPLYMAPEVSQGKKYGLKADLWSIGCIFYEMVVGHRPYEAATQLQLIEAIKNKPVTFPPGLNISDACKDLILKLLQKDPSLRISKVELIMHPFLDYEVFYQTTTFMKEKEELMRSKIDLERVVDSPLATKKILEELKQMITTYGEYEVLERENVNEVPSPFDEVEDEEGFINVDKDQVRINQLVEESTSKSLTKSTLQQAISFTDQYFKNPSADSHDILIEEVLERYTNPTEQGDVQNIIFHTQRLVAILKSADHYKTEGREQDAFYLYVSCNNICKYLIHLLSLIHDDHGKLPKTISSAPSFIQHKYSTIFETLTKLNCNKNISEKNITLKQAKFIVSRARELAGEGGFEETTNIENSKVLYIQAILHFETVLIEFYQLLKGDDEHHIKHQISKIIDRLQSIQKK